MRDSSRQIILRSVALCAAPALALGAQAVQAQTGSENESAVVTAEPEPGRATEGPAGEATDRGELVVLPAVDADSRFRVFWTGSVDEEDQIALMNDAGGDVIAQRRVTPKSPVAFAAPAMAGSYTIVYRDGRSGEVIAASRLDVR